MVNGAAGNLAASSYAYGGAGGAGSSAASGGAGGDVSLDNDVNAVSGGQGTVTQLAYGGTGGSSSGGTAGRGGNASSVLNRVFASQTSTQVSLQAYGGAAGAVSSGAAGAAGGTGHVGADIEQTTAGKPLNVQGYANGGTGSGGVAGGDASASMVARSTQNVTLGANLQAGAGGNATSNITASSTGATANVYATQTVTASTGEASGTARTEGVDSAALWSRTTTNGVSGTASAISTSTSGTRSVSSEAHAGTSGSTLADATASYAAASTLSLPNLNGGSNGLQAFAYSYGALNSTALNNIMLNNPNVAAAVGGSFDLIGGGVLGANYGSGASGSQTYTAVANYTFTVDAATPVSLGLLDFTHHGGGFDSLTLTATRGGATLFSTSFNNVGDAAAFLDDRVVSLGNFNAGVRSVKLTYTLVADSAQGADMSYLLTANAGSVASGAPATAAATPSTPTTTASRLSGLMPTLFGTEAVLRSLSPSVAVAESAGSRRSPVPARRDLPALRER